ncbi:hypothetical protein [Prosthecomicrobium sp. N25]|uniref:hypothetical protein n=1 Tax=Prosthecomicrobium sp. N25 TaxID=3129254 RepID=UPI003076F783
MPAKDPASRARPSDITTPRLVVDMIDGIGKDLRRRLDGTRHDPLSEDLEALLRDAREADGEGRR